MYPLELIFRVDKNAVLVYKPADEWDDDSIWFVLAGSTISNYWYDNVNEALIQSTTHINYTNVSEYLKRSEIEE